jgi:hypothetical protein
MKILASIGFYLFCTQFPYLDFNELLHPEGLSAPNPPADSTKKEGTRKYGYYFRLAYRCRFPWEGPTSTTV